MFKKLEATARRIGATTNKSIKGMIQKSTTNETFYKTKSWRRKRESILRRDEYLCRECKRYGKTTQATTVHHIYPLEDYPGHRLTGDNLLSVCDKCHNTFHDRVTNELTDKGMRWMERIVLPPPL